MKKLIERLLRALQSAGQKAKTAVDGLKPLESQQEAAQLAWFFTGLRENAKLVAELGPDFEKEVAGLELEYDAAVKEQAEKMKDSPEFIGHAKAKLIASGEVVDKATKDSLIETAKAGAEKKVRDEIASEKALSSKIGERRTEIAKALAELFKPKMADKADAVATEVASGIPDKSLAGDDYKTAALETAKARTTKFLDMCQATPGQLKRAVAFETAEAFDAHFKEVEDLAASFGTGGRPAPLAGGGSGGDGKKPALVF